MMEATRVIQVDSDICYMDTRAIGPFGVSGVYVLKGDGLTLIEAGTSLTAPHILETLRQMGYQEGDLKRILVTHVHLDHAGAVGWWVKQAPQVQVFVHERGAIHLQDPSKLIHSAKTVYGSLDEVFALHGEILPVPRKNLMPVLNGSLEIGKGLTLKLFPTPGHAPHHLSAIEPERGYIFSGEALGHYYPESDLLIPAVAPPSFDLTDSLETIGRIRELRPKVVCFSQFGPHPDPPFVIQESVRQITLCDAQMKEARRRGLSRDEIIEKILQMLAGKQGRNARSAREMMESLVFGFESYYERIHQPPSKNSTFDGKPQRCKSRGCRRS
jgi:glyoxylase-like metal-dependent hydrolase (beta-lactamase superfamily II)